MKTIILSRKHRAAAGLVSTLLWVGLGLTAQAQPFASPVGIWDLKMGHARHGTAYMAFGDDFTISGFQIHGFLPLGVNHIPTSPRTNAFGSANIDGHWSFDHAGRVVGFYSEIQGTNAQVVSPVSFVATVKSGKKLSMIATIFNGRDVFLKGVLAISLPDIGGTYLARGMTNGANSIAFGELLSLKQTGFFNHYDVTGIGAGGGVQGHEFTGEAILSANGQISLITDHTIHTLITNITVVDTNEMTTNIVATNFMVTNIVIREFTGPVNLKKIPASVTSTLRGIAGTNFLRYNITLLPPPPE